MDVGGILGNHHLSNPYVVGCESLEDGGAIPLMRRATAGAPRPQHYRRSTPPLLMLGTPVAPHAAPAACCLAPTRTSTPAQPVSWSSNPPDHKAATNTCYCTRELSIAHGTATPSDCDPVCARFLATYSGTRQIQPLVCAKHPARLEPESSIALVGRPASRIIIDRLLLPKTHHQPQSRWYVVDTLPYSPHHTANKILSLSSRPPSQ